MDQDFDPYFELLGIPKVEQPPNCYRLLSIPEYTSNKQVIANGAARQMQFLRRVGGDQFLGEVQNILNEISKARIVLLDDEKRAKYDRDLKSKEKTKSGHGSGSVSESMNGPASQSQFHLSAPIQKELGRAAAIQLLYLSGPHVGETISLNGRDFTLGPSSKFDVMLPTRNGATFNLEHEIDQWILVSDATSFAINGRLVNGLTTIKDGDILRFSVDGPDLQFIEEIDLMRHLETLGKYENVAESRSSNHAPIPAASRPKAPTTRASNAAAATRPVSQNAGMRPQNRNVSQPTRAHRSKLIKKPESQQNQGVVSSIVDIANRALGREKSFAKKTGATYDWQIGVFWLVVGCALAAIAAGIIFGWKN